jgi:uncharacterized damage-inducible protein DinB
VGSLRAVRPEQSEHLPYYGRYIDLVPDGDIVQTLATQLKATQDFLASLPASMATHRYAAGKWSVNEMIGHMADTERIFTSRALRFARNDHQAQPGFEQDDYVRNANFEAYPLAELASEFGAVRHATIYLFRHLGEDAWMRRGIASGGEVTVRALAYMTAGHELHHREILRTRYLRA